MKNFDVIIVGAGHAGTEAAHAAARLGCQVALITLDKNKIGFMSCNPAIGGLAKGNLTKEIDALGGLMALNTDDSALQYRVLNTKKGPAVRGSRAQCDKLLYAENMKKRIFSTLNISVIEAEVSDIIVKNGLCEGIKLRDGSIIYSQTTVITSGTFLCAVMHTGNKKESGGRVGDKAANDLSKSLKSMGFNLRRLKTGTPPRLHKRSIPFENLIPQYGDPTINPFSFYFQGDRFPVLPQIPCFITYTNLITHEIIEENLHLSPMYSGEITGIGPRYCPSIEDKVKRFPDKDRHQIFLEPEGLDVNDIYINGVSTSLPAEVQEKFIRSIAGLENAEFIRFGYAVEYDAIDARQLKSTYESKDIKNLYFAGQINGTSGYEEAGGQGILAGINAGLSSLERPPFLLTRFDSYIGVMTDDLVLKGSDEPYRMFTSRAEYRLVLREDNADIRLTERAYKEGLINEEKYRRFCLKIENVLKLESTLKESFILPDTELNETQKKCLGGNGFKDRISFYDLLKRPFVGIKEFKEFFKDFILDLDNYSPVEMDQIEIQTKYKGYIERENQRIDSIKKNENQKIPLNINFSNISGLSNEIKLKLNETKPETLGQMSRIQGITPAAVASVLIHIKTINRQTNEKTI